MTRATKIRILKRWGWSYERMARLWALPLAEIKAVVKKEKIAAGDDESLSELRRQGRIIEKFDKVAGM